MKSSDYRQLKVWQKAMDLTVEIYSLVNKFPREENYALYDQMRRSVVSIPSNIAEGQGRNSAKEFVNFLSIARGSLWELETQIEISERLHYINSGQKNKVYEQTEEIGKMLNALATSLEQTPITRN
ncbi:MAG: four helix bundle protein [Bacteroidaceae bacterium]|nr:four helix bundle protein [Bacteroidaceae bacterium]